MNRHAFHSPPDDAVDVAALVGKSGELVSYHDTPCDCLMSNPMLHVFAFLSAHQAGVIAALSLADVAHFLVLGKVIPNNLQVTKKTAQMRGLMPLLCCQVGKNIPKVYTVTCPERILASSASRL